MWYWENTFRPGLGLINIKRKSQNKGTLEQLNKTSLKYKSLLFSVLHDLECNGNESHITDCHFGNHQTHTHECTGLEKAGLK